MISKKIFIVLILMCTVAVSAQKKNKTLNNKITTEKISDANCKEIEKPSDLPVYKTLKANPKVTKGLINEKEDEDLILLPEQNYLANQIINNAMQFIGVRYRTGGTTPKGMDCSGFITAAFNIFDLKLPRCSVDMSKVGEKKDKCTAKKGDLIFFRTLGSKRINHVGMVIDVINDEIQFIHSSCSKGVTISSTSEAYYKKAMAQINNVLN